MRPSQVGTTDNLSYNIVHLILLSFVMYSADISIVDPLSVLQLSILVPRRIADPPSCFHFSVMSYDFAFAVTF